MRKIRVLRLSHSATLSAYRERDRVLSQCPELELALLYPRKWPHLGGNSEPDEVEESFFCRQINTYGTGSVPLFAFDPLAIADTLIKFKPDIVDIHEEPYSTSCIESMLLTRRFAPDSACVFYSAQNINKKYPPPFSWGERFVYNNSQGAYPCSTSVQEVLREKGFLSRNCPVIPIGIDLDQFLPRGKRLSLPDSAKKDFVVGFTGRIESCKGLDYLLHALRMIVDDGRDSVCLVIAGSGKDEPKLRALSQTLGISANVLWLGAIDADEMSAFYRTCDCVIVPSVTTATWREQFGRVPVEAMACGTPVVASDSGSLPEVVDHAGIVVPEKNALALAEALERLIADKTLRANLSMSGSKFVAKRYSWETVARMMLSLYEQALALKTGTPLDKPVKELVRSS